MMEMSEARIFNIGIYNYHIIIFSEQIEKLTDDLT